MNKRLAVMTIMLVFYSSCLAPTAMTCASACTISACTKESKSAGHDDVESEEPVSSASNAKHSRSILKIMCSLLAWFGWNRPVLIGHPPSHSSGQATDLMYERCLPIHNNGGIHVDH